VKPRAAAAGSEPVPAAAARRPYDAFDLLASMVAVVEPGGACLFVNAAFEQVVGLSRRSVTRGSIFDWFVDPALMRETIAAVSGNQVSTSRFDALLRPVPPLHGEPLPVHVIVNQTDPGGPVVVEMMEIEQQTRQEREERALDQARATKELIRNLAHEIKNPLGGIRGAAQLLQMEVESRALSDYTQVIIGEADRLQSLVDRLLVPHRNPQVVGDVNIHEVCERVRSLILAEFPRGLTVERDYDISIPEFRGDREQLIQAVLNIVQNAAQALTERIASGTACISFRTRVARQVTLGKRRYRLALELRIRDNGPGVPASIREHIFYPLVSGRDGGSGLGLTLAQTFVQQHQGTIECESVPGNTVFKIEIPLP
jgi:two-component system nitrogen regulation sensor histidine kinase GlnL